MIHITDNPQQYLLGWWGLGMSPSGLVCSFADAVDIDSLPVALSVTIIWSTTSGKWVCKMPVGED